MHLESSLQKEEKAWKGALGGQGTSKGPAGISLEEIDQIINKTFFANQGKKSQWKKRKSAIESYYEAGNYEKSKAYSTERKENYLLVDGYNIIHDWQELKEHIEDNMEGARLKLLEILSNYQWLKPYEIIVVFDAYRVIGHQEEIMDYENIHVVYTKEAQTADQYIEKFAHDNKKKYNITVATSDGMQQLIVRGSGGSLLSARELKLEIDETNASMRQKYKELQSGGDMALIDGLPPEVKQRIEKIIGVPGALQR